MPRPDPPTDIDPELVSALAAIAGLAPLEPELAARLAAGASRALAAVTAHAGVSLFDTEPSEFLAELERLADDD